MSAYKVTIPENHYLGMKVQEEGLPLGFLTPWVGKKTNPEEADNQTKKRMDTVDYWVKSIGRQTPQLETHIIKNKPISGFKISQTFKRGGNWGASRAVWRIEDPRGFELEISNGNMVEIMLCTVINEGEILTPCVWGRCGQENILIPTSTDEYKIAMENTKIANSSVSLKDVNIGNKIQSTNGMTGIYLGAWFTLNNSDTNNDIEWSKSKKHFIMDDEKIHIVSSIKISSVLDDSTLELVEAQHTINNFINSHKSIVDGFGYGVDDCYGVSLSKPDFKINSEDYDKNDLITLVEDAGRPWELRNLRIPSLFFKKNNKVYTFAAYNYASGVHIPGKGLSNDIFQTFPVVNLEQFMDGKDKHLELIIESGYIRRPFFTETHREPKHCFPKDFTDPLFKLTISFKDDKTEQEFTTNLIRG